jgi:hypothetical protein
MYSDSDNEADELIQNRVYPPGFHLTPLGLAAARQDLRILWSDPTGAPLLEGPVDLLNVSAPIVTEAWIEGWNERVVLTGRTRNEFSALGFVGNNWDGDELVTVDIRVEGHAHLVTMQPPPHGGGVGSPVVSAVVHRAAHAPQTADLGITLTDPLTRAHFAVVNWGDGLQEVIPLGVGASGSFNVQHHYGQHHKHETITVNVIGTGAVSNTVTLPFTVG